LRNLLTGLLIGIVVLSFVVLFLVTYSPPPAAGGTEGAAAAAMAALAALLKLVFAPVIGLVRFCARASISAAGRRRKAAKGDEGRE
jgi:hypothetical protein